MSIVLVLAGILILVLLMSFGVCMIHEAYVTIKKFKAEKQSDTVRAFRIVNKYIKKHYPFARGKTWDKKHGNIHFMLGSYTLEEYIEALTDEEVINNKSEKARSD